MQVFKQKETKRSTDFIGEVEVEGTNDSFDVSRRLP